MIWQHLAIALYVLPILRALMDYQELVDMASEALEDKKDFLKPLAPAVAMALVFLWPLILVVEMIWEVVDRLRDRD